MIGDGDLETIFASGDFDVEAVFTITASPLVTLTAKGWFTGPTDETVLFGNVHVEAAKPTFMCQTSDVVTVRNKMSVVISTVTYQVERMEKVGTGVSVIYLKT